MGNRPGRGTAAVVGFLADAIDAAEAYPTTSTIADTQTRVLGAGALLPAMSEDLSMDKGLMPDETLDGGASVAGHEVTHKKYGGGVPCQGAYQGLDELWACALGYEAHYGGDHASAAARFPNPVTTITGTATSGSATTVVDSGAPFGANDALIGYYVRIYEGTGAGQVRRINDSTSTTLTVPTWTTNPDNTSKYETGKAWLHHFECDDDISTRPWEFGEGWLFGRGLVFGEQIPRRGTLCIAPHLATQTDQPKCLEYCASMVKSITLTVNQARTDIVTQVVAFYRDRDATNQDPTTWTLLENVKKLIAWPDYVFRMDDYSAGTPLSAADKIRISSFSLTLDNMLVVDDQDMVTGLYIAEPARGGPYQVSGTFTTPRYTSDTLLGKFEDDTILMADLKATGDTISDSDAFKLEIYMRSLKLRKAEPKVSGAGLINVPYEFTCQTPAAAPNGMPAVEKSKTPLIIRTQNQNPYHAFRQQY